MRKEVGAGGRFDIFLDSATRDRLKISVLAGGYRLLKF